MANIAKTDTQLTAIFNKTIKRVLDGEKTLARLKDIVDDIHVAEADIQYEKDRFAQLTGVNFDDVCEVFYTKNTYDVEVKGQTRTVTRRSADYRIKDTSPINIIKREPKAKKVEDND